MKTFTSTLVKKLKGQPDGEDARRMLRIRMEQQLKDPSVDPMTERLLPILKEYSGRLKGRILDVGCYTGFLYHFLGKPKDYTGIDKWPEVIKVSKEFSPEADFRACDLKDMAGEFDVVWSSQVVWDRSSLSAAKAVEKMRLLAPKRIFVLVNSEVKDIALESRKFGPLSVVEEGWEKN